MNDGDRLAVPVAGDRLRRLAKATIQNLARRANLRLISVTVLARLTDLRRSAWWTTPDRRHPPSAPRSDGIVTGASDEVSRNG
jgi:hypothetical protein